MTVWLIYERRMHYDVVVRCCATEAVADKEINKLLKLHPKSDGYYADQWHVKGSKEPKTDPVEDGRL